MFMDTTPTITDNFGGENAQVQENEPKYPNYIIEDEDGNQIGFYTMEELAVNNNTTVASEPIEKGSWASYNRVIEPIEITSKLVYEGEEADIQDSLDKLNELCNREGKAEEEKKVKFITPFSSYENLTLESFDYRRDSNSGHNVLRVDIRLKEIREVESAKTTSSVEEPPQPAPVSQSASADASCVSSQTYGETPTYTPSASESSSAESGGKRQSALYQILL